MNFLSVYHQAIVWFLFSSLTSVLNDVTIKFVGCRLDPFEIAFWRFFLSTLTLLPFMLGRGGFKSLLTPFWKIHTLRGFLLFLAMTPWCWGVTALPLTMATTISFTTPLFVLFFSGLFLGETVGRARWLATLFGFIGIVLAMQPDLGTFKPMALLLVGSTVIFATLDVINKKLVTGDEGLLSMLFFSALGTAVFSAPLAVSVWQGPTLIEMICLAGLGAGANLILYFLLRAFALIDLSALQPFRYGELLLSCVLSFVIFQEVPALTTLWAAAFIIPSTLYIARHDAKQRKKAQDLSTPKVVNA